MKIFFKIILILIIIIWTIINILSIADIPFFVIRIFKVGSGSMEPYLKVNDLIIIKTEKKYNEDDIITFEDNGYYTTHRIIKIDGNTITTKGDSNNTNDPNITEERIVGKVIYRLRVYGFLSYLLLKPYSWVLIYIIGLCLIFLMPGKKSKGKHVKQKS